MTRQIWARFAIVFAATGCLAGCGGSGNGPEDDAGAYDTGSTPPKTDGATPHCGASKGDDGTLCAIGQACKIGGDCSSTVCQQDLCVLGSCADGVKDGDETDVDCGGSCGGCATGKACKVGGDCESDVCKGDVCLAATDHDGVKNGGETAVDCGGAILASGKPNPASDGAPACVAGKTCLLGSDCASDVCADGLVRVDNLDGGPASAKGDAGRTLTCQAATDQDGVKNASETDVDCGGGLLASGAPNPASDGAPSCAANQACVIASDCASGVCTGGTCQAPSATDMVKNDSETDVDCGGGFLANGKKNPASDGAHACDDTRACVLGTDCVNLVCSTGPVTAGTGTPGAPVDCPAGQTCTCIPASPTDGVDNDSETDIDCGGGFIDDLGTKNPGSDGAPVCQVGQGCSFGSDCFTGVCNDNMGAGGLPDDCPAGSTCTCQGGSDNDGVKNGGETDVDCGGASALGADGAPACAVGKGCVLGTDCVSLVCFTGVVTTPSASGAPIGCPGGQTCTCQAPTAADGVQNGGETDIDCGGAASACVVTPLLDCAPACSDAKQCTVGTDCRSSYCGIDANVSATALLCVDAQSCTVPRPLQAVGIMDISVEADTAVGGMDAQGQANVNGGSQTAGIDTCGSGEATDAPSLQHHESCCKSLRVAGLAACSSTTPCPAGETCSSATTTPGTCQVRMDKYEVTTGRVRQFLEKVKFDLGGVYDLQTWVTNELATPTSPVAIALQQMIPTSGATSVLGLFPTGATGVAPYLSVVAQLGATTLDEGYPSDAQGCYTAPGAFGAGTYWWDAQSLKSVVGSPPRPFTQDYYDIKPQNCAPYWIAAAFCAWDGGRLPTKAESDAVYGGKWTTGGNPTPPVLFQAANGQPMYPNNDLAIVAANAGYLITDYTINYHNAAVGASTGLGEFYYYPSYVTSNPGTGPLGGDAIINAVGTGLDQSPFISAPGRFTPDITTAVSPDGGGWTDYGANMMEYLQASSLTGNIVGEFCDTTNPVSTNTTGSCPSPYCARPKIGTMPQQYDCGVVRATQMPGILWEGGSWEGHGIQSAGYNEPMHTQYGKAGFRCVRPVE